MSDLAHYDRLKARLAPRAPAPKKRRAWSEAELQILREHYPSTSTARVAEMIGREVRSVLAQANQLGIKKTREFLSQLGRETAAKNNPAMRASQFKPGHSTWNKGQRYQAGGRSKETQFQPGKKPHTYKPIGSERLFDGYRQRKLTDAGYPPADWVMVHVIVWMDHVRGPMQPGCTLTFRDGDKTNVCIENLEVITRAELMRRNSIHNRGPEIARLHQLVGAIQRQINKRKG